MHTATTAQEQSVRTLKQPKALSILFMTEVWERFSYWSVQSLLVLYMTKAFLFSDSHAYLILSAFNALLWGSPVLGGWLADRAIGAHRAILIGALMLCAGYVLLIIGNQSVFYLSLVLLTLGNGLFKPNVSNVLGTCYQENDSRRDGGFTWFYFAINVGATIGILLCGFVAKKYGWNYAFAIAALAMLAGFLVYSLGLKQIVKDQIQTKWQLSSAMKNRSTILLIIGAMVSIWPIYWLLQRPDVVNVLMIVLTVLILGYLIWVASSCEKQARRRFYVCIILVIMSVVFWSLYMQLPMSMTLFVARNIDLHFLGINFPASTVSSLNGIFLMAFAPFMVMLWAKINARKNQLSFPTKFAVGIILMAIGYLVVALGAYLITPNHRGGLWSVILSYAFQSLGELWLSPIGLAMITVLAPEKVRGMMMGVWFFAIAGATLIAGQLAKVASVPQALQHNMLSAPIYSNAFLWYGAVALIIGIVLMLSVPFLKKLL